MLLISTHTGTRARYQAIILQYQCVPVLLEVTVAQQTRSRGNSPVRFPWINVSPAKDKDVMSLILASLRLREQTNWVTMLWLYNRL